VGAGPTFDLACAIYVAGMGLVGMWRGAVREFFAALAVVMPALVSIPAYFRVGVWLADRFAIPLFAAAIASFLGIFAAIALACKVAAWAVEKRFEKSEFLASFNRSLGCGFGVLKASAVCLALGIVGHLIPAPSDPPPDWMESLKGRSRVMAVSSFFVKPLVETALGGGPRAELARAMLADPKAVAAKLERSPRFREFATSERVRALFETPKMKALLEDPEMKRLAESGDTFGIVRVMFGPKGREALNDPALLERGLEGIVAEFTEILNETPTAEVRLPEGFGPAGGAAPAPARPSGSR